MAVRPGRRWASDRGRASSSAIFNRTPIVASWICRAGRATLSPTPRFTRRKGEIMKRSLLVLVGLALVGGSLWAASVASSAPVTRTEAMAPGLLSLPRATPAGQTSTVRSHRVALAAARPLDDALRSGALAQGGDGCTGGTRGHGLERRPQRLGHARREPSSADVRRLPDRDGHSAPARASDRSRSRSRSWHRSRRARTPGAGRCSIAREVSATGSGSVTSTRTRCSRSTSSTTRS